jgi:predicted dehydrogenase
MNRREFMSNTLIAGVTASIARTGAGTGLAAQTKPGNRTTVGLIGSGARGQELLQAAAKLPGVEFVAVSDAYQGRMTRARARTSGRAAAVADYRQILASKEIDAVIIATPDHWHKAMTIEALQAGKDVYVEKPLTYTIDEGQQIVDAARRSGRILQVGSQVISSATVEKAKEMIRAGRLGQITLVRASYNRNTAEGAWIYPIPPDASERTVNWDQFIGPAPKRPFSLERFFRWRCYWDYSGGIATDLFVHLLTTIHFMMDAQMPSRVVAMGQNYRYKETHEVPDTVNAVLEYPEGFAVNLSSTFNNQASSESGFEVLGTEAALVLRGDQMVLKPETAGEDNGWVVSSWPEGLEKAYYANPKVMASEVRGSWTPRMRKESEAFGEVGQEATFVHMARFFESARLGKPIVEDGATGHRAAAAAHLVNQSIRQRRPMDWNAATGQPA